MGDSAYGSAEMLGWLVHEHRIKPHLTVFDKSARQDASSHGTTSPMTTRATFTSARRQEADHHGHFGE
jgi:hypothetical protein